ncbi:hypothetical protein ACWD25_17555 [Streptomyces sp. NPDC002920]
MEITHQSVRDYADARKRGDRPTADRVRQAAQDRFNTRTTDGSELAQMLHVSMTVPFGGQ